MIIDFCKKYDMLPRGCTVLAAVSGGKDSVFLLEKLLELAPELELKVACAHFDHRLRGAESDRDREFVRSLCEKKSVPCYMGQGDVSGYAEEKGLGLEEAARILRYEFLESAADEAGAQRIATAHTADDNLETLMMNLLRGSGLRGLGGIPPVRGRIVRPLLETPAEEILQYLNDRDIAYVEDSTNADDFCLRNRVRHRLIPLMRELNPAADSAALRCISLLRQDEEYLSGLAEEFYSENFKAGMGLPAGKLAALPEPVSARVLRLAAGRELSLTHTQALLRLAADKNPHGAADIPGLRVRREYDRLVFEAGDAPVPEEKRLFPGNTFTFKDMGLSISCEFIKGVSEIHNSVNTFFLKSDSICGNIFVGPPRGGEEIRLVGRGCTKKVKKLFAEARIPMSRRGSCLALRDDNGLVALAGFGRAERCRARAGDDVFLVSIYSAE